MIRRAILLLPLLAGAASTLMGQVKITSTSPLPEGYSTIYYTYTFTEVTNPLNSPVTWMVTPGYESKLPQGITVSANGTLAGTTPQIGTFVFNVTARYGDFSDTQTFSLTMLGPVITINTPPMLPNGFVGQAYSLLLSASSNPAGITWLPAQMPPGLTLSPQGLISGNPSIPGTYTIVLTAQILNTSTTTNQAFSLTVYSGQVNIQTTTLPTAFSGQPYSATVNGGPSGLSWSLIGMLPPGITFGQTTGVFSGSSTFVGAYPLQIQGSFPNYLTATRNLTLYLTNGPLAVPQPVLPTAVQYSPYTTTVTATGGLPPYTWSFATTNTNGLSINSSGTITGTPTVAGMFMVPITLGDQTGQSLLVNLSLFVANPLSVSTTALPNGNLGIAYSQQLLAGGGTGTFTWSLASGSGALPPGLSLAPSGVISGTPSATGTFTFTVQVGDSGGRTATHSESISISVAPLSITSSSLPNGQLTVPYSQALAATGGVAPYTWTLISGSLPPGLTLSPTGTISGSPTGPLGSSSFAVQVTDSSPLAPLTAQKAFTISIQLTLSITTLQSSIPTGTKGVAYPQTQLQASGGTTPYTWSVVSGALPPGLQLNATSGVISGTPTSTGSTVFTVVVTDATGQTASGQLSISINPPGGAIKITTGNLSATAGAAFSQTLAATGGTPPYTWSITGGSLPAGLSLSGNVISGTPTAAGSSNVTLQVTDSQQQTGTGSLTITVNLPSAPQVNIGAISGNPATQQPVSISLSSTFPVDITGTLAVSFQSAVGGNPTEVQFLTSAGGSNTATFTIPAGTTKAVFAGSPVLATGTVAGTITLTTSLSAGGMDITPSPAPTATVTIAPAAPVIQSVKFSNTGGNLTVTVIGYSTTREIASGQFTFAPATGSTLSQSTITVQLGSAFAAWYGSAASNQWGGQFMLTIPFTVSATASDVVSVSVTLTNTKGTSSAASPQ